MTGHSSMEERLDALWRDVDSLSDDHPNKPFHLNQLGNALQARFEHSGKKEDIESAVLTKERAVKLTPDANSNKCTYLSNLGNALRACFEHSGKEQDLESAALVGERAVGLAPDGNPNKPMYLNNFGNTLMARFEHSGKEEDLESAVLAGERTVELTPDGHPDKPMYLGNLGNALRVRFEHSGREEDLESAILVGEQAVNLTPDSHPYKPAYLTNLGNALMARFERFGKKKNLESAVLASKRAVGLTPDGHPNKPTYCSNLGVALRIQFEHYGKEEDLKGAILAGERAVELTSDGNPNKPSRLNNLGNALRDRFKHSGKEEDLERAILLGERAVKLSPDGHLDKPVYLNNLGNTLNIRFKLTGKLTDVHRAISCIAAAATSPSGSPRLRLRYARNWALLASKYQCQSCHLDAHATIIELIPQVFWLNNSIVDRYDRIAEVGDAANEAAAAAISAGDMQRAIEWLEEGRAVVWGQILRLRTPLDDLRSASPDLAHRLHSVLTQLGVLGSSWSSQEATTSATHTLQQQPSHQYRTLVFEHEKLIEEVRELSGFNDFQSPRQMAALRHAAKSGPVVILNIARSRCDALVLPNTSGEIIHIPLPDLTHEKANSMQDCVFERLLEQGVRARGDSGQLSSSMATSKTIENVAEELWMLIVHPILIGLKHVLTRSADGSLPRITWCGAARLPMHAAGMYGLSNPENDKTFHHVVSSYTPTLSALLESHRPPHSPESTPHLLAISQPDAPSMASLQLVSFEASSVCRLMDARGMRCEWLDEHEATKAAVLLYMEKCNWVHFACHGSQNATKSALHLYDRPLELDDVMHRWWPHADLAVLSACQTAQGTNTLPDEAAHLAAGLMIAGYRSVIATMWSIEDMDGPELSREFYQYLIEEGGVDSTKSAYALHYAVEVLREMVGEHNFARWVPFVHFGA